MNSINIFDIVVLVIILIFGLRGISTGLIKEIFSFIGIIGGVIVAVRYKMEASVWVSQNLYDLSTHSPIDKDGTGLLVGFLVLLFGTWIICLIIGELLSKLLKLSGFQIFDKIGGFIFSVVKVFLILAILAAMIKTSAFLNDQTKPYFQKSLVFPSLVNTGEKILKIKKIDVQIPIENTIKKVEKITDDINSTIFNKDINNSTIDNNNSNKVKIE